MELALFRHVIDIKAIVNSNGSRNLEPNASQQITDPEEIRRLDAATRINR